MLQRLHEQVESGCLPRTLLSHYASLSKDARTRQLKQIPCVEDESVIRKKARLLKLEPGEAFFGDKAFNGISPLHANMNEPICPHHLIGDQFTVEELEADEGPKSLRWTSETFFDRVTDDHVLHDRISRSHFPHLHHVVDYAHGRANLYGPFYVPKDDTYFADFAERKRKNQQIKQEGRKKRAQAKKASRDSLLAQKEK
jgi:hypothetical protein